MRQELTCIMSNIGFLFFRIRFYFMSDEKKEAEFEALCKKLDALYRCKIDTCKRTCYKRANPKVAKAFKHDIYCFRYPNAAEVIKLI